MSESEKQQNTSEPTHLPTKSSDAWTVSTTIPNADTVQKPRNQKQKKEVHKVTMTEGKHTVIQQFFQEYDIESANDSQEALLDLWGGTIKEMLASG